MDDNDDLLGDLLGMRDEEYDFGGGAQRDQQQAASFKKVNNNKSKSSMKSASSKVSIQAGEGGGGGEEDMIQVEEEDDGDGSEDDFASDFEQLDSFLTQKGVSVREMPLKDPADEEEDVAKQGQEGSNKRPTASSPPATASRPASSSSIHQSSSSLVTNSVSIDSTNAAAAGASVASSSNRQGTPSPINLVTPANQFSADEASLASGDDSYEPFSPPFSPNGWEKLSSGQQAKSAHPSSAPSHSKAAGKNAAGGAVGDNKYRPLSTGDLPGRQFFNRRDDDYENEEYEEDADWPSSPSKSAAKLWSLRKEIEGGKEINKDHFSSIREALLCLTQHDKPKKKVDLKRLIKIAEPRKSKVERKFGKDEEAMNCYFKPRKSAKALAAARNPACGYDFIRRAGEEDDKGDFLRRTDLAEKKRLQELEYARGEAEYVKSLNKKSCPSCGAVQSYSEVIDKRKKCPNCLEDYRAAHIFDRQAWAKRLEEAMKRSERRRATLKQKVLIEMFGGIKNVPKGELGSDPLSLESTNPAAAAAISTPAGAPRGRRSLSPLVTRRRSSSAAAPSPERKALNEIEKLLKEADSDGEQQIDVRKLKNVVAAAAAAEAPAVGIVKSKKVETAPAAKLSSAKNDSIPTAASASVIPTTPSVSSTNRTQNARRKSSLVNQGATSSAESNVEKMRQSTTAAAAKGGALKLEVGDKVEARFGGRSQFFKGKVVSVNADGSYDIQYEDGEQESNVKPELIKQVGESSNNNDETGGGGGPTNIRRKSSSQSIIKSRRKSSSLVGTSTTPAAAAGESVKKDNTAQPAAAIQKTRKGSKSKRNSKSSTPVKVEKDADTPAAAAANIQGQDGGQEEDLEKQNDMVDVVPEAEKIFQKLVLM